MDRRSFLKGAAAVGAAASIRVLDRAVIAADTPAPQKVVLKLCSQDGRVPGKNLREKIEKLQKWGAAAVELGGNPDVKTVKEAIKDTNIKVAALCWGSHGGDLVSPDAEKRKKGIADMKIALEKAGELESTGVIFVPTFNGQSKLTIEELDKLMLDMMPEIGDYAQKVKSRVLFEPLNRGETYYIRRVPQAAALCNKINNPGICQMGDFYHMSKEETNDEEAFTAAGKWLYHVHLATGKSRIMPGQEQHVRTTWDENKKQTQTPLTYSEGFRGLKKIGYQWYCSLECGCLKGTDVDAEIQKCFDFLRKQWDEAVV